MTKKISNKILEKIKQKKISPKPKWEFLLKDYVFWSAFILSILIGALSTSLAIFRLVNNDWDIYEKVGDNFFTFTLKTMPYFSFLVFAVFVFIAFYNFKHTKKGYKYGFPLVIVISVFSSIVLGFALFGVNVAKHLDQQAMQMMPFYKHQTFGKRIERWQQAEKGVMAGKIIKIEFDLLELENLEKEIWKIDLKKIPPQMKDKLKEEMIIGIMGEIIEKGLFEAEHLRPWRGNFINMKENKLFLRTI
jgi:hypothetical protein